MDLQLNAKVALITGGSKGIGFACAQLLKQEGAQIAITARTVGRLSDALVKLGGAALALPGDLIDAAQALSIVQSVEEALGPIDILVNCAGAARRCPPSELRPAQWREAMDSKFFPYINVIDPVITRMAERGNGVVINIIGNGGRVASPAHLAGGAANAALMLATAGLATAYGPMGVRVVGINPGLVATDRVNEGFSVDATMGGKDISTVQADRIGNIPLGRMGTPEEVAAAVAFLASPLSSYTSGTSLTMDGALSSFIV